MAAGISNPSFEETEAGSSLELDAFVSLAKVASCRPSEEILLKRNKIERGIGY